MKVQKTDRYELTQLEIQLAVAEWLTAQGVPALPADVVLIFDLQGAAGQEFAAVVEVTRG